jgi:hypothetical protein
LRRKVSRFEAMNGNRIETGAQLECKGMRKPLEGNEDTQWAFARGINNPQEQLAQGFV